MGPVHSRLAHDLSQAFCSQFLDVFIAAERLVVVFEIIIIQRQRAETGNLSV